MPKNLSPCFPEIANCEAMRDYFDWHVQNGRGKDKAVLDKRGLGFLVFPQYLEKDIGLCLPPADETQNPDLNKVFVRATF